jgi:hypothetical protein
MRFAPSKSAVRIAVALANELARIISAVTTTGAAFRTQVLKRA